jgi:RNA polymerase sigma-70 factor, ECF subfamily
MKGPGEIVDLEQIYLEARSSWPGLEVDKATFGGYLRERMRPEGDDPRALHLADLYLACACIHGASGALEAFERRYLAGLGPALRSIDTSPAFFDEVTQLLREKLFVGSNRGPQGGPPAWDGDRASQAGPPASGGKLATYSGRGSLESWVSVAVHRLGLSLKRRQRRHTELSDEALTRLVPEDPELAYLRARYREEFQAALTAAVVGLTERQQVILRLTLVKGVSHARIAAIYGVNQSTVTSWATAARQRIWEELRHQLADRLRMGVAEVDSLIRFMKSDIQLSIPRTLEESPSD